MTLEQNLSDLEQHAQDFHDRVGFTYTVLDPVDRDVIGCVYLYPSPLDGVDVRARSWVRRTHATWTNRSGERSAHGSTGRIGRSSGSTSPRADPPTTKSAEGTVSPRTSGQIDKFDRRILIAQSVVYGFILGIALCCCLSGHTDDVLQVQRYAYPPDRLRDHAGGRVRAATLAGTSTGRTPAVSSSSRNWLPTPSPERRHTANRVDPPCQQPPAVLIIWPAAPSIIDANPRAIANVAAAAVRVWAELNTWSGDAEGRLAIKIT